MKDRDIKYCSLTRRIISAVIDGHIVGFAVYFLWLAMKWIGLSTGGILWMKLALITAYYVLYVIYSALFIRKTGMTPGQSISGARVLMVDGSAGIPLKTAFLRGVLFLVYFIPFVGVLAILASAVAIAGDERHQAWHDRISGTIVVARSDAGR